MEACFRHTASSWKQSVLVNRCRGQGPNSYRRDSQEHDDELVLTQSRMADESVCEACQTSSSLLNEQVICSNVLAIDCILVSSVVSNGLHSTH
jgi:hypothetical protein